MGAVINRLKEASTWRGILLFVTAFGIWKINPDQQHAIEAILLAVFGASHLGPDKYGPDNYGPDKYGSSNGSQD